MSAFILFVSVLLLALVYWILKREIREVRKTFFHRIKDLTDRLTAIEKRVESLDSTAINASSFESEATSTAQPDAPATAVDASLRAQWPVGKKREPRSPLSWSDLETKLGENWLSKIGVGILVIGVALLIGSIFQYLDAAGKIGIGYAVALGLLVLGLKLERKKGFALYARSIIGGGWALVYFTTYALHFIESVRLVSSPLAGLVLLSAVVAAMVKHSLVYRSQTATGVAYALGFITVSLSDIHLYSLLATFLLAASLVALCVRFGWFQLQLPGAAATYLVHLLWFYDQPAFTSNQRVAATTLLVIYWLLFLSPNYLYRRRPGIRIDDRSLAAVNLANAGGFLALLSLQAGESQWFFPMLLVVGAVYMVFSALSRKRGQRSSYLLFATLGVGVWIAAIPVKVTGAAISITWLVESEMLMMAGFFLGERHFRNLSWLSFTLVVGKLLFWDFHSEAGFSVGGLTIFTHTVIFLLTAGCLYLNRHLVSGRFANIACAWEVKAAGRFTYAASLLVLLSGYELPTLGMAPAWGLLAVILVGAGIRWSEPNLRIQGYAAGILTFGRLLVVNLTTEQMWNHWVSFRLITVPAVVVCFYSLYFVLNAQRRAGHLPTREQSMPRLFSLLATISIAALAVFEIQSAFVAAAWGLLAVFYLALGSFLPTRHLRCQGYGLVIATAVRAATTNLLLPESTFGLGVKIVSTAMAVAMLFAGYGLLLWARSQKRFQPTTGGGILTWVEENNLGLCFYPAAALMMLLTWMESPGNLLTILWGVEALCLFGVGLAIRQQNFRLLGLGMLLVCTAKIFFYDLNGLNTVARIFSFIVLGVILLLVSFLYTRFGPAIRKYLH